MGSPKETFSKHLDQDIEKHDKAVAGYFVWKLPEYAQRTEGTFGWRKALLVEETIALGTKMHHA